MLIFLIIMGLLVILGIYGEISNKRDLSLIKNAEDDETKMKLINKLCTYTLRLEAIEFLQKDKSKEYYIIQFQKLDFEKFKKDIIQIIESFKSDDLKIKYLDSFSDNNDKFSIIKSFKSDSSKIKALKYIESCKEKAKIIETFKHLENIKLCLLSFDTWNRAGIIESFKSDDLKVKYLDSFSDNYYKISIIESFKSDDLKIKYLDSFSDNNDKISIIESLDSYDLKIKYLDSISDNYTKIFSVFKFNDNEKIKAFSYFIENLVIEQDITEFLGNLCDKNDRIKQSTLQQILDSFNDNEKKEYFIIKLINYFKDNKIKILLLNNIIDENLKTSILKNIISIFNNEDKLSLLGGISDDWSKADIINECKNEDKIQLLTCVSDNLCKASIKASIE